MNKKIKSFVPKNYREKLRPAYLKLFGHTAYEKFAIVAHARTGSNYLYAGLNTSASIKTYHEIFAAHNREIGRDFDKIFTNIIEPKSKDIKAVGFKVFYYHLTEEEWKKFLSYQGIKIIHLTRENKLRTIVSLDIAFKTDIWSAKDVKSTKRTSVIVDTADLIARIEKIESDENKTRQRFLNHRITELVYESMVEHPIKTFSHLSDFMGIHDIDPHGIAIKKQNPEKLSTLIENYEEVVECLSNSRFSSYLE